VLRGRGTFMVATCCWAAGLGFVPMAVPRCADGVLRAVPMKCLSGPVVLAGVPSEAGGCAEAPVMFHKPVYEFRCAACDCCRRRDAEVTVVAQPVVGVCASRLLGGSIRACRRAAVGMPAYGAGGGDVG
jgi:hypothetical protein